MTVTYTAEVATVRGFGCFIKLLKRWRGSIYKLVWMDLLLFLSIYYTFNCTYRFVLDAKGKELFENIVKYCKDYSNIIPLSFVLGFYVSIVMARWWNQYTSIPFPDTLAVFVSATVHGQDERGRVMRRTIMRYVCLCVTMMFTMISPRVKKRFPTLDHFIDAGLLQQSEKEIMASLNKKFPTYSKHWLPIVWAASIITRARKEGRIRDDFAVKTMIDELNKFRGQCGLLLSYDNISVPLVYTQVVTLAVYSYFLSTLMGHQWVDGNVYKFDLYLPFFTLLEFFFYVGWLKVAESLINPFGDDDDDFEVNWMIDRNLQISYLIVDEMHHDHPELVRDQYWDEVFPQGLPYTADTEAFRETHPLPSTANIAVKATEPDFMGPSSVKVDDMLMSDGGPIVFCARPSNYRSSRGSQASIAGTSVPDSISRQNSVTSMLKKFFTREDSRTDKSEANEAANEMIQLTAKTPTKGSVKKITDEIIEEVDEQSTITSQKDRNDVKPSVFGIFGPPEPSKPIPVPNNSYQPSPSEPISIPNNLKSNPSVYDPFLLSASAPAANQCEDMADNVSIGNSNSDEDDEFDQLKKKRSEERLNRLKQNLLRSLSINTNDELNESEQLLLREHSANNSSTPRSSTN